MQLIFKSNCSPNQYYKLSKAYPFPPPPETCPICNTHLPMRGHGFYRRNIVDISFSGTILIRRYICQHCGKTVSFIPDFCMSGFQYSLNTIWQCISSFLVSGKSIRSIVKANNKFKFLSLSRQLVSFYIKRFCTNVRKLIVVFGSFEYIHGENIRERCKNICETIERMFPNIYSFSIQFHKQTKKAFLAPFLNLC